MMSDQKFLLASTVAALALCSTVGAADISKGAYPARSVRLITGSTGSTSDITARFIAAKLGELWSHQVVVDNRAGVGGIIGGEIVANAAPDGHTLT